MDRPSTPYETAANAYTSPDERWFETAQMTGHDYDRETGRVTGHYQYGPWYVDPDKAADHYL